MSAESTPTLLEATQVEGVTVVRFTHRTILDPAAIESVGNRLVSLVRNEGCRALVLDFARVESLTSGMLGKFIALHIAVEQAHARLVFSSVSPFLMQIFTLCNIPKTISIHSDEASAVQALQS
jgi:anti-anti-sigma factor